MERKKKEPKIPLAKPSLETLQEEIRKTAAEVYQGRMAAHRSGDELSDWLQAEKEVKKRFKL